MMNYQTVIISLGAVKAEGITASSDGENVIVMTDDIPPDCAVVFVDKLEWKNAKKQAN